MRKALFYVLSWALIVLGLPLLAIAVICDRLSLLAIRSTIADNYLAHLARCMLRLTGSAVQVEGLHRIPQGPVVLISNHQGHFDSAVILAYIRKPKAFIASTNAEKFPIFRTWFNFAHTIYLEKDNARQNHNALQDAKKVIAAGRSVVIYPEGVISSGPQMAQFKRGAFKLAFTTGVPIVPLVIDGTWKVMGSQNDTIQPAKIMARVLPPVSTKDLSRLEQQALPDQIYRSIEEGLEDIRSAPLRER